MYYMISEHAEAKRARVRAHVTPLGSARCICVDETSTPTAMTRRYARAPRGERAYGRVPRHGPNLSRSGALGLRGMVATMSVEGASDTDAFAAFVAQGLGPALPPGDLVLRANRTVPRVANIQQAVSAVGGDGIFLPPSSPDFSPIEPCGSKLKTFWRGYAARPQALLAAALTKVLLPLSPDDIRNCFRHCGYEVAPE